MYRVVAAHVRKRDTIVLAVQYPLVHGVQPLLKSRACTHCRDLFCAISQQPCVHVTDEVPDVPHSWTVGLHHCTVVTGVPLERHTKALTCFLGPNCIYLPHGKGRAHTVNQSRRTPNKVTSLLWCLNHSVFLDLRHVVTEQHRCAGLSSHLGQQTSKSSTSSRISVHISVYERCEWIEHDELQVLNLQHLFVYLLELFGCRELTMTFCHYRKHTPHIW